MERHQRNIIVNEKLLRKYLVLSPTVIKVMEQDRLFPESFVQRLKTLRPLDQNSFMIDYVLNFQGVEAYENFLFLLRKTSQAWLTEIIESGKAVDMFMHFRPDELANYVVNPPGVDMYGATGYDPLYPAMNTYDYLSGGIPAGYAADYVQRELAPGSQPLLATGVIDMVRECRQRQLNSEQRLVHLQREQLALKQRIGENQREQMAVAAEQQALRQLAVNADKVTRLARQTEVASSVARASLAPAALPIPTAATVAIAALPAAPSSYGSFNYRARRTSPTRLGLLRHQDCRPNNEPPVPITSNLTLNELARLGPRYS